jgi:hypothetical protein
MAIAKNKGYKGKTLQGAIDKLEELFEIPSDELKDKYGGPLQHHFRDFAHHPTIVGLSFSIMTQFTGMAYGTDTAGKFQIYPVPSSKSIGKDFAEKISFGVITWAFHLISDMAGSSDNPGAGVGIPGPLLAFFKEMSVLPFFKDITISYKDKEIAFSAWLSKWYNGTYFMSADNPKGIRFDLRTEIGMVHEISRQAVPIIMNECIVRGFYFIRRLLLEIQSKEIHSITDFAKLEPEKFLPFKNRKLTRMITISSGVFMTIDASAAAIGNLLGKKNVPGFFLSINYIGIGRFAFACKADSKYIAEDFKHIFQEFLEKNKKQQEERINSIPGLQVMMLNDKQARILHSLKLQKILYDIEQHKDDKKAIDKIIWKNEWIKITAEGLGVERKNFFIKDEKLLYGFIKDELADRTNTGWLYLVAMELFLFDPYQPLNTKYDKELKGLKNKSDYEKDIFCKLQTSIDEKELRSMEKMYHKYENILNNNTQKVVVGVAAVGVVTLATGGFALTFAPQIAALLAGQAVVGLSGAALTSASLAFVGGGSLAVGGMGMAGGTAIIAGGGALIGITSSGVASLSSVLLLSSKGYTLNECAKLLTFCKLIILEKYNQAEVVEQFQNVIEKTICDLEQELPSEDDESKEENQMEKKLDKERKSSLKYLKRCNSQLKKMTE